MFSGLISRGPRVKHHVFRVSLPWLQGEPHTRNQTRHYLPSNESVPISETDHQSSKIGSTSELDHCRLHSYFQYIVLAKYGKVHNATENAGH
jgi:hypothetical protein